MGDKVVAAVDGLEKHGSPIKLHFWKCIEGLIPPDLDLTAAIRSDPTYAPLCDALKRPLVNLEVKIAADVNFITVNIWS